MQSRKVVPALSCTIAERDQINLIIHPIMTIGILFLFVRYPAFYFVVMTECLSLNCRNVST
jgi:hypothetical protein